MLNKMVYQGPSFYRNWILFILGVVLICIYSIQIGVFKNPDEGAHYLRAYEIASGHYLNGKGHIGSDISCNEYVTIAKKYAPIAYYQEHAERGGESCYVKTINSASTYPPTAYIFLASMIKAGHVFDLSIEKTAVLCRVINGLFCFILIYIAINRMSHAKYLMFCVLFSPMVMVMLSAVSADSVTIALTFSFFSCLLYALQTPTINKWHFYLVLFLSLLIGSTKIIYCLLCFSYVSVFINKYGFNVNRQNFKTLLLTFSPGFLAVVVSVLGVYYTDRSMVYLGNGAQPLIQMVYILHNPIPFAKIVFDTMINMSVLTQVFTPVHVLQPKTFVWSLISIMVSIPWFVLLLIEKRSLNLYSKCFLSIVFVISLCLVVLPLYLTYSPPGYGSVLGVQGRYFLPIILLLPFLLPFDLKLGNVFFTKVRPVLLGVICLANVFVVYKVCF